ncbi:cysteine and tyrosine-rich protein 1-like [Mizuhopecten yessoensis]|uniref:cysteine and tyrosine-rich protein 1-like n=1 Tax=Mizuhopecten yessoensis TaxID=6573 RepID=UPI000B45F181|nr:cysteine and tyrosine-rich protein 1-like [Mizuhopecten yessoensis]
MGNSGITLFLLTVILQFREYLSGSTCYEQQYNYFTSSYYYTYYGYCSFGCCGYTSIRYCCISSYYTYEYTAASLSIGVIVGAIIGGLVFLGVMIAVVICCICKCTEKSRGQRGAVVAPATTGGPGVAIVNSHVNMPMQPQPYYQMQGQPIPTVQPPPYNNVGGLQYTPAAYPPPPPAYPPTAPPQQPDHTSSPFALQSNIQSSVNSAPPTTKHH